MNSESDTQLNQQILTESVSREALILSLREILIGFLRETLTASLRERVVQHIETLRLADYDPQHLVNNDEKERIRMSHSMQRAELNIRERRALGPWVDRLLPMFATGRDIVPDRIDPEIVPVISGESTGYLFRLVTLLWTVPVSHGYGRRMRFLIIDRYNQKLIGILALGDPVFNLKVRDDWIEWNAKQREERLVNMMDAYVVGAVPPYTKLLGGKLITSIIGSREVSEHFNLRYGSTTGLISNQQKHAKLTLVTITSALGRSSMYNRVRLPGLVELIKVGITSGWGHFHIPNDIFEDMKKLLLIDKHPYALGYKYGNGPNWRMRVIRTALEKIGLNGDLLRHGIAREVYVMPLATNWKSYLQGQDDSCDVNRPPLFDIVSACLKRWVIPRAERNQDYRLWSAEDTRALFTSMTE